MPYQPKDKLGRERAVLRNTYPYLHVIPSRHDSSKLFIYYAQPGKPRVRLHADPWRHPQKFREEYEAAKRGEPAPEPPRPGRRSMVGTWNAAIDDYQKTHKYESKADNTKRAYAPYIKALRDGLGSTLMRQTDPFDLFQMHDEVVKRGTVQANTFLTVLSSVVHIGRLRRWVPANLDLLYGIEHQDVTSNSFRPYVDGEIEQWRQHHQIGTMARAAFELAYGLALGTADLITLAPSDIDDFGNIWKARRKTGTTQTSNVQADPMLREVLERLPAPPIDAPVDMLGRSTVPFLRNQLGKPFAADGSTFRKQWRRWATEAGLPADFNIHGARATMVTDMMDAGVSNSDGMRRTGHLDERVYKRIYGAQASATKAAARAQDQLMAARARKAGNGGKPALRAVG